MLPPAAASVYERGMVGVASTVAGVCISNLDKVEQFLRITSLFVGIAVGVATLIAIRRANRRGQAPKLEIPDGRSD